MPGHSLFYLQFTITFVKKNMILVADSGSTKTHWKAGDNGHVAFETHTIGLNPYFLDTDKIYEAITSPLSNIKDQVKEVFFYGAGCSGTEVNNIVICAIKKLIPQAKVIVDHDLLAAARATCKDKPGIACILGTGSNSCLYDGSNIIENVPSLGFILGDEGGGVYIGKKITRAYFYKEMPNDIALLFQEKYKLDRDEFLDSVYRKPMPNTFLANFAPFVFENSNHPYCQSLIQKAFIAFFESFILKYTNYNYYPLHFIGSIAFTYSNILFQLSQKYACNIGLIIKEPIEELFMYHTLK